MEISHNFSGSSTVDLIKYPTHASEGTTSPKTLTQCHSLTHSPHALQLCVAKLCEQEEEEVFYLLLRLNKVQEALF